MKQGYQSHHDFIIAFGGITAMLLMILTVGFYSIQTNTSSSVSAISRVSWDQSTPVGPDRCPAIGNPCGPIIGIAGGYSQCCVRCADGTRRNFQAPFGQSYYRNDSKCQDLANRFCGCIVAPTIAPTEIPTVIPSDTPIPTQVPSPTTFNPIRKYPTNQPFPTIEPWQNNGY